MKLALLGATGSIGRQTLDVMKRHRDRIALSSATCGHDAAALEAAVRGFDPALLGVTQPGEAFAPRAGWVWGPNANERAILDTDCDTVLDAGAAQNAGCPFAAVLNGTTPAGAFASFEPVHIATDLFDLARWLGL